MANVCTFEMRVKGTKENCYAFFNSDIRCYEIFVTEEHGTDADFILCIAGECRYSPSSMFNADTPVDQLAAQCNIELEIFGYDISEPEWVEHYHFRGGECIYSFNLPTSIHDIEMLEEFDIDNPEEAAQKYKYIEQYDMYVLMEEYHEPFEWDEDERVMHLQWRIPIEQ